MGKGVAGGNGEVLTVGVRACIKFIQNRKHIYIDNFIRLAYCI